MHELENTVIVYRIWCYCVMAKPGIVKLFIISAVSKRLSYSLELSNGGNICFLMGKHVIAIRISEERKKLRMYLSKLSVFKGLIFLV